MALIRSELRRALARLRLHLSPLAQSQDPGGRRSRQKGTSVEFSEYREYEPGDDYRHIDWNLYARLDRLFVRLFVEEKSQRVNVLLDTSRSMERGVPPKIDYGRELAAALGMVALWSGEEVRAGAAGETITWQTPYWRGRQWVGPYFHALERVRPEGKTHLSDALGAWAGATGRADANFLITDLLDPAWPEALSALARSCRTPVLIQLLDREDWDPSLLGDCDLIDVESGERLHLELDEPVRAAFRQSALAWLAAVRAQAGAAGIICFQLDTSLPLEELLLREMRKRGVLL